MTSKYDALSGTTARTFEIAAASGFSNPMGPLALDASEGSQLRVRGKFLYSRFSYEDLVRADGVAAYWPMTQMVGNATPDESGQGADQALVQVSEATEGNFPMASSIVGEIGPSMGQGTVAGVNGGWVSGFQVAYSAIKFSTSMTVEAWVSPDPIVPSAILLRQDATTWTYRLSFTAGGLWEFQILQSDLTVITVSSGVLATNGLPIHVVGVADAATGLVSLYINGLLAAASVAYDGTLDPPTGALRIGHSAPATDLFTGRYGHFALYPHALTSLQIARHFQVGLGRFAARVLDFAPVGYWRLNEQRDGASPTVAINYGTSKTTAATATHTGTIVGGVRGVRSPEPTAAESLGFGGDGSTASIYGDNDLTTLENNAGWLNVTSNRITVLGWVKIDTANKTHYLAYRFGNTGSDIIFKLAVASGSTNPAYFAVTLGGPGGTLVAAQGATSVPVGKWAFLVGTWDGLAVRLYVNGRLDALVSGTGLGVLTSDVDSDSFIGNIAVDANGTHGMLQDVAILPVALTPEEIDELYKTSTQAPAGLTTDGYLESSGLSIGRAGDPRRAVWTPGEDGSLDMPGGGMSTHSAPYEEVVRSTPGLIYYWPGDEGQNFTTGKSLAWQDVVTPVSPYMDQAPGLVSGRARSTFFDRVTPEYVSTPNDTVLNPSQEITIELWVSIQEYNVAAARGLVLHGSSNTGANFAWGFWVDSAADRNLVFSLRQAGGVEPIVQANTGYTRGQVHHLVAVARRLAAGVGWIEIWSDGTLINKAAYDGTILATVAQPVYVGTLAGAVGTTLEGHVQHVAIYNRALSPGEILNHHGMGRSAHWMACVERSVYLFATLGKSPAAAGTAEYPNPARTVVGTWAGDYRYGTAGLISGIPWATQVSATGAGTGGYVSFAAPTLPTTSFGMGIWIQPKDLSGLPKWVVRKGPGATATYALEIVAVVGEPVLQFTVVDAAAGVWTVTSSIRLQPNRTYFVFCLAQGNKLTLFVNGRWDSEAAWTAGTFGAGAVDLLVGADSAGPNVNFFDGVLSGLSLFNNQILSAADILSLYQAGSTEAALVRPLRLGVPHEDRQGGRMMTRVTSDGTVVEGSTAIRRLTYTFADTPISVGPADGVVLLNATAGDLNVYLQPVQVFFPTATTTRRVTLKRIDAAAHTVTLRTAGGETIDGAATAALAANQAVEVITDGSNFCLI
jgi:hypothetical protein